MSGGGDDEDSSGSGGRVFEFIRGSGPTAAHGADEESTPEEDREYDVMLAWVADPWKLASLRLGITVQDIYMDLGREYTIGTLAAQLARTVEIWADNPYDKKLLVDLVYRIIDAKLGGNPAPKTTT